MSSHSHSASSNRRQIELELELDSTLSPLDALASHTRKLTIKSNHHHQQQQRHRNQPLPKHQHSLPSTTTTTTTNPSSSSNYPPSPYYSTTASNLYSNPNPSSSQSAFNRPSLYSLIIPNQPPPTHSSPIDQLRQQPSSLLSPHFNQKSEAIRNSTATFATDSTDYVWDRDDEDDEDEIRNDHQSPHHYHQALPTSMLRRPSEGRVTRSIVRAEEPTERISSVYGEQESVTDENASSDPHAYHYQEEEEEEEALEVLGSQQTRSRHDPHHSHRSEQYDDDEEDDEDEDDDDEGGHSIRYESGQSLSSMNPFQYSHYESNRIPTTAVKSANFPKIKTHQAASHNSTIIIHGQSDRLPNFNDHHHQQQQQDMLQTPISLSGSSTQSGLPSLVNPHERVRNFSRPLRPSTIVKVAETDLPTPPPSRQISPSDAKSPSHIGRTRASTTTSRSSIQSSSSSNGTRRSWKNPFAKRRPESFQSNREEEEQASADRRILDCYDAVDRITRGSQIQPEYHSTPSITFNQPAYTEEVNRPSHYDYQGSADHQRNYDHRASHLSSTPSHYEENRDSGSAHDMAYEGLGKGPTSKPRLDHRLSIYSLPKDDLSIEQRLSKDPYMSRSPVSSIRNSPRPQSPIQDSSLKNHSSKPSKNLRQSQLPPAMAKAKAGLANLNVGGSSNGVIRNRTAEDYLQLGIDAHEKGEMERSAGFFERSAREGGGCGTGMLMWGLALRHGWGCQVNETRAFKWLQKAAESVVDEVERVKAEGKDEAFAVKNELVLAVYELGQCFMRGWGCKKDKALAINYFELAARLGDPDAQQELGFCYSNGKGTKKDLKKAAKYYRMASKQGIEMMGSQWIWKAKYD